MKIYLIFLISAIIPAFALVVEVNPQVCVYASDDTIFTGHNNFTQNLTAAGYLLQDGSSCCGGSGNATTDHAALSHLDYASSGHTGFQAAGSYLTDGNLSGQLFQAALDNSTFEGSNGGVPYDGSIIFLNKSRLHTVNVFYYSISDGSVHMSKSVASTATGGLVNYTTAIFQTLTLNSTTILDFSQLQIPFQHINSTNTAILKRKSLDKITNGNFTGNANGWNISNNPGQNWTYNNNRMQMNYGSGSGAYFSQYLGVLTIGREYEITFSMNQTGGSSDYLNVKLGGVSTFQTGTSTIMPYTLKIRAISTNGTLLFKKNNYDAFTVDTITVKENMGEIQTYDVKVEWVNATKINANEVHLDDTGQQYISSSGSRLMLTSGGNNYYADEIGSGYTGYNTADAITSVSGDQNGCVSIDFGSQSYSDSCVSGLSTSTGSFVYELT